MDNIQIECNQRQTFDNIEISSAMWDVNISHESSTATLLKATDQLFWEQ